MKLYDFYLLNQTVLVPIVVGLVRLKKLDRSYDPFILLLIIGFINNSIGYTLIKLYRSNTVSYNLFQLVECLFIFELFRRWGFLKFKPRFLKLIAIFCAGCWLVQNIIFLQIRAISPYFTILYAFILVLIIVNQIIYVANENTNLLKNGKFIICVGLIIFFIYHILLEGAYEVSLSKPTYISNILITYIGYVNVFVIFLYTWSMFVIPKEKPFPWKKKEDGELIEQP